MKIYNLGSLNIDYVYSVEHFVRPGETLATSGRNVFPGGKGLNQSVALARAGAEVIHGGLVGDDGELLTDTLKSAGVDISRIKKADCSSGHAIIQVDASGQNCILLYSGANHRFTAEYIDEVLCDAKAGDILLAQNETNGLDMIFEAAHERGMRIAFNPSPFDSDILKLPLGYVDYWLCNEIEGSEIAGCEEPEKIIDALSERFPDSNIILTLGKNGAIFKSKQEQAFQPIFKVKTVDTTAAGDTFTGFLLAAVAEGKSPAEALRTASAASAIAVSRAGASCSVPAKSEVEELLQQAK